MITELGIQLKQKSKSKDSFFPLFWLEGAYSITTIEIS
jgi:hypothetical protein